MKGNVKLATCLLLCNLLLGAPQQKGQTSQTTQTHYFFSKYQQGKRSMSANTFRGTKSTKNVNESWSMSHRFMHTWRERVENMSKHMRMPHDLKFWQTPTPTFSSGMVFDISLATSWTGMPPSAEVCGGEKKKGNRFNGRNEVTTYNIRT